MQLLSSSYLTDEIKIYRRWVWVTRLHIRAPLVSIHVRTLCVLPAAVEYSPASHNYPAETNMQGRVSHGTAQRAGKHRASPTHLPLDCHAYSGRTCARHNFLSHSNPLSTVESAASSSTASQVRLSVRGGGAGVVCFGYAGPDAEMVKRVGYQRRFDGLLPPFGDKVSVGCRRLIQS